MVRYIGPKHCKIRAFGPLPSLKQFSSKVNLNLKVRLAKKLSDYGLRLKEKQKLRYNYGISETQLYNYVKTVTAFSKRTANDLLSLIERRLDNVVYSLGFTLTIGSARQLINHGKVYINNKCVTISSFICNCKDIIWVKVKGKQKEFFNQQLFLTKNVPLHLIRLSLFFGQIVSCNIKTFNLQINERLVIEFYSKR